jgi:hypothetical protein
VTLSEFLVAAPLIVGPTWALCAKLSDVAAACRGLREDVTRIDKVLAPVPAQIVALETRLEMT